FLIPDVGDEVLVIFLSGDPRFPIVAGGLWNGRDTAPETLGGARDAVDRWTITGKGGTRIAIVEEGGASKATIEFSTPGRLTGKMSDSNQSIEFTDSKQTSVKIDAGGVTISAPAGKVQITAAAEVDITAP